MFNKKAASSKSKPDEVLKALDIKPGQKIADIGSGGGYFSLRFAEAVGRAGQIYAIDTKDEYLDLIRSQSSTKALDNIKLANISKKETRLPDNFFDLIFFRNSYHHLENRVELMKDYRKKLKANGRIAIIEYLPGKGGIFSFRRIFGHNVPKEKIIYELEQAGFKTTEEYTFLPEQSFTVYKKK
jgi:arsenite methyltransferase